MKWVCQEAVSLDRNTDRRAGAQAMDPAKDVDGFHPLNVGRLLTRGSQPAFVPCTALGCMELLLRSGVDVRGKTAVILVHAPVTGVDVIRKGMRRTISSPVTAYSSRSKSLR